MYDMLVLVLNLPKAFHIKNVVFCCGILLV